MSDSANRACTGKAGIQRGDDPAQPGLAGNPDGGNGFRPADPRDQFFARHLQDNLLKGAGEAERIGSRAVVQGEVARLQGGGAAILLGAAMARHLHADEHVAIR